MDLLLAYALGALTDPIIAVPAVIAGLVIRRWWLLPVIGLVFGLAMGALAVALQMDPAAMYGRVLLVFIVDGSLAWALRRAIARGRQSPRRPMA
jgi:hypothetical protein